MNPGPSLQENRRETESRRWEGGGGEEEDTQGGQPSTNQEEGLPQSPTVLAP